MIFSNTALILLEGVSKTRTSAFERGALISLFVLFLQTKEDVGMQKKLFKNLIAGVFLVFSSQSFALVAFLESCSYKYIRGWGNSVYVGVYKSSISEDRYTRTFKSFCPKYIKV